MPLINVSLHITEACAVLAHNTDDLSGASAQKRLQVNPKTLLPFERKTLIGLIFFITSDRKFRVMFGGMKGKTCELYQNVNGQCAQTHRYLWNIGIISGQSSHKNRSPLTNGYKMINAGFLVPYSPGGIMFPQNTHRARGVSQGRIVCHPCLRVGLCVFCKNFQAPGL